MKQSEILMVRKAISDEWEGIIPGTPFLKRIISREEIGFDFWIVHDLEDKYWYVIDRDSGLLVTRAKTRKKVIENFGLLCTRALNARGGKGYEEAKKRLIGLKSRPIWDPKKENWEEFLKRLAGWGKSYMEED